MEIVVGRNGEQPFPIKDPKVSGKHLKVTLGDKGEILIEDNHSTNGTFVDGQRIIRKMVTPDTIVQLGPNFTFMVGDIWDKMRSVGDGKHQDNFDPIVMRKFEKLEAIYDKYIADKISLQKENASKAFLRVIPMSLIGIIGVVIGLIPALGPIRWGVMPITIIFSIILMIKAYNSQTDLPERMTELDERFKIDYVCPKCKNFLGFTPFKALKNKKQCSCCKVKWVR